MQLRQAGEELWTFEGAEVDFHGFPFSTRMTVARLADGTLWVHSPEQLNDRLRQELAGLGEVRHLVSPNPLHHLFLPEWIAAYPDALAYAAPGLAAKRRDIAFDRELSDTPEAAWRDSIDQLIFRGSPAMEEAIFLHRPSRTLILTDLIENFRPEAFHGWRLIVARLAGILHPNGRMPLDWRLSFLLGSRQEARQCLARILDWEFDNVILAHGECIFGDGHEFFRRAFEWLER